jgi:hypothetical protein
MDLLDAFTIARVLTPRRLAAAALICGCVFAPQFTSGLVLAAADQQAARVEAMIRDAVYEAGVGSDPDAAHGLK